MNKDLEVLGRVNDVKPIADNTHTGRAQFFNGIKMMSNNPDFIPWREEAKHSLRKLKPNPLIDEIISLLDGFQGYTDERDYQMLQSKIKLILDNPDEYLVENDKGAVVDQRLSKGAFISTAFDDYELTEQVGQGGNGRVFSAKDSEGKDVAIKFVEKDISTRKYKRLKNEINFCEKNEHKNIVHITDHGIAHLSGKDYVFYVMPLFPITLEKKIKTGIEPDVAISIFIGIIQGLKFAHDKGIIHRDIKPENILFAVDSDEPVICDFGIAHFSEEELLTAVETKAGEKLANFQYAAPEQKVKGGATSVTARADVYAAGLILNEMFTGEVPQASGYKKIADVNPEYALLDKLFEKLFQQNPDDRLFPAEQILIELSVLLEGINAEKAKQSLERETDEEIEDIDFNISITKRYFQDDMLVFELDSVPPKLWMKVLVNGYYAHSATSGYNPKYLEFDKNIVMMPLKGLRDKTRIQEIATQITDWIPAANKYYVDLLKKQAAEKRRKEEIERKQEAAKMQEAAEVNSYLAEL